jgi:hypothetical protein
MRGWHETGKNRNENFSARTDCPPTNLSAEHCQMTGMDYDNQTAITEEFVAGSRKIFLFFGGIGHAIGMTPYEFYQSARILQHNKIFIRDFGQAWYQRGVCADGGDPYCLGEYLEQKIRESGASEIHFVGNSMGGFAALLFCAMLRRGSVIAFSPQTFTSKEKRSLHNDTRWPSEINRLHSSGKDTDIYDLKPWIARMYPEMKARIFVSTSDELDEIHANELADFPHVEIHRYSYGGHGIVKTLRDNGSLAKIFLDAG